jgi:hypothetical protein
VDPSACGDRDRARRRRIVDDALPHVHPPEAPCRSSQQRRARLALRHHLASAARASGPVEVARDLVALHGTDPASAFLGPPKAPVRLLALIFTQRIGPQFG